MPLVARSTSSLAAAALTVTSPLLAVAAVAIRWRMGRPVLFRHERAGRDGVPFELLKLRSMRPLQPGETAPDADGARITPLGRVLRTTSIDELPSLVNVLRGDMGIVGPRPLPVRYLDRYTARQRRRLDVRPGVTGWAQINGRNATRRGTTASSSTCGTSSTARSPSTCGSSPPRSRWCSRRSGDRRRRSRHDGRAPGPSPT